MRDRLIELPIDDAILILKEEHKQRVDGYTTHLSYGGKGDPAEEISLDALEMAISALEQTNCRIEKMQTRVALYLPTRKKRSLLCVGVMFADFPSLSPIGCPCHNRRKENGYGS